VRWTKGQSGRKRGTVTRSTDIPEWGNTTLDQMDQRGRVVRAMRQDLNALHSDLGGLSNISVMEKILCEKIVQLKRLTEKKEALMLQDQQIDEGAYVNAVSCLSGLVSKLGLKRRAKQIHSLSAVLNAAKQPAPQPNKEDA
jgi:hypothetical protein